MLTRLNLAPVPFMLVAMAYLLEFVLLEWQGYTLMSISGYDAALGIERGDIVILGEHSRNVRFEGEVFFGGAFIMSMVAGLVAWWRPAVGTLIGIGAFFLLAFSPLRMDGQEIASGVGGSVAELRMMPGYHAALVLIATGVLLCGGRALRRRKAL